MFTTDTTLFKILNFNCYTIDNTNHKILNNIIEIFILYVFLSKIKLELYNNPDNGVTHSEL